MSSADLQGKEPLRSSTSVVWILGALTVFMVLVCLALPAVRGILTAIRQGTGQISVSSEEANQVPVFTNRDRVVLMAHTGAIIAAGNIHVPFLKHSPGGNQVRVDTSVNSIDIKDESGHLLFKHKVSNAGFIDMESTYTGAEGSTETVIESNLVDTAPASVEHYKLEIIGESK